MTQLVRKCSLRAPSDMKRWKLIRDGVLVIVMVGCSFTAGWWAYGRYFANSRRVSFDFSKPYVIPRNRESIGTAPTPDTASFLVGDRIDIFVQTDNSIEPLILDAVVTHQRKTNFGMLLPHGGRDLLGHARDNGLRLVFRLSNSPTDPVILKPYRPATLPPQNGG